MAEYIEREAVMKTAKNGNHSDFGRSMADLTSLRELLEDIPTADVSEVRRGEWYWYEEPHHSFYDDDLECGWKCSCCDNYPDHDNYMADSYEDKPTLKFCPNCGAKMDGKDSNDNE